MTFTQTLLWLWQGLVSRPLWHLFLAKSDTKCARFSFIAALCYINIAVTILVYIPLWCISMVEKSLVFHAVGREPVFRGFYPILELLSHPEIKAQVIQNLQNSTAMWIVFLLTVIWAVLGASFFIARGAILLWQRIVDIGRVQSILAGSFLAACWLTMFWNALNLPYAHVSPVLSVGMLLVISFFPSRVAAYSLRPVNSESWFARWVAMPLWQIFEGYKGVPVTGRDILLGSLYTVVIFLGIATFGEAILRGFLSEAQQIIPTLIGIFAAMYWMLGESYHYWRLVYAPYWIVSDFTGTSGYIFAIWYVLLPFFLVKIFSICQRFIYQENRFVKTYIVLNVLAFFGSVYVGLYVYILFALLLVGMAKGHVHKIEAQ